MTGIERHATLTFLGIELLGVAWVFIPHLPLIHFPLEGDNFMVISEN